MAAPKRLLPIAAFWLMMISCTVGSSNLSPGYYHKKCPKALSVIKQGVKDAVKQEKRMGASLLRLHFHDCFVNGCDGSILLDSTATIDSEKNALPNNNSARGFDVIDSIKTKVDKACRGPIVSCADILAVAARDSVVELGGPHWEVKLGRKDSTTASRTDANNQIPSPFMDLQALLANFKNKGLNAKDLTALSGAHTIGFAHCRFARPAVNCPQTNGGQTLVPLDQTPSKFDTAYYRGLIGNKGLLGSDQALLNKSSQTGWYVRNYVEKNGDFEKDFVKSILKMGDLKPLARSKLEVRVNCRRVNH